MIVVLTFLDTHEHDCIHGPRFWQDAGYRAYLCQVVGKQVQDMVLIKRPHLHMLGHIQFCLPIYQNLDQTFQFVDISYQTNFHKGFIAISIPCLHVSKVTGYVVLHPVWELFRGEGKSEVEKEKFHWLFFLHLFGQVENKKERNENIFIFPCSERHRVERKRNLCFHKFTIMSFIFLLILLYIQRSSIWSKLNYISFLFSLQIGEKIPNGNQKINVIFLFFLLPSQTKESENISLFLKLFSFPPTLQISEQCGFL